MRGERFMSITQVNPYSNLSTTPQPYQQPAQQEQGNSQFGLPSVFEMAREYLELKGENDELKAILAEKEIKEKTDPYRMSSKEMEQIRAALAQEQQRVTSNRRR